MVLVATTVCCSLRCVSSRAVYVSDRVSVRIAHGLGWVGLGWVEIFQFLVGLVGSTIEKVLKI